MRIRAATPADAEGMARLHVDAWRSAYRHIFPASFLDGLSYEMRAQRWRDRLAEFGPQQFTLVAVDEGAVLGLAGGGPERDGMPGYDGEIYAVYVAPAHQRCGIGRQLMAACARQLAADRFRAALLWVLEENHRARAFYAALGGQPIGRKEAVIGETPVVEVAYGWPELAALLGNGMSDEQQ
jgi:ribosomal protein S18 acetylase RimI-like enzyme